MKNTIFYLLISAFFLFNLYSCGKDKPLNNESQQVTTTKNGKPYVLDTLNSRIEWKGYKIVNSEHTNHFGIIKFESGEITLQNGKLESGKFVANIHSINNVDLEGDETQKAKLVAHLKSTEFFEADKFPTATYEITKVSDATNGGDYNTLIDGNLTIKGITKPVQFYANVSEKEGSVSIATEPKDINRQDFGIKFQIPIADGLIKDEANIQMMVKATEKK